MAIEPLDECNGDFAPVGLMNSQDCAAIFYLGQFGSTM